MKQISRTPKRILNTPRNQSPLESNSHNEVKDNVNVYCRLRPLQLEVDLTSLRVIDSKTICMNLQDQQLQDRPYYRQQQQNEIRYKFKHIFKADASQREVFAAVAQPLVENLICGRDSLLFTYGVTGSGKTHTMTGDLRHRGILPRCLDQLFCTIADYQAKMFIFKPDRLNGFEILSEREALQEQLGLKRKLVMSRRRKSALQKSLELPPIVLDALDENNMYSVFITYIEIYNNSIYDLLEVDGSQRSLQSRIIREDATHRMYVHGVNEMEVKTVQEALQVFQMGQKRKHMAHTVLNQESSRSHSVFSIRLVQAPNDTQSNEQLITVSQLSLVDLAGSERFSKTKTTGVRLREAGNINNSLMTLRTCLEYLRENQQLGNNAKKIPYRDSKLTHMFKSYFDGEGQVSMIVCTNPRIEDYDENLQVMKFAEMTQEVQILRAGTPAHPKCKTPNLKAQTQLSLGPDLPSIQLSNLPETKLRILEFKSCLQQRSKNRKELIELLHIKCDNFRRMLIKMDENNRMHSAALQGNKDNIPRQKRSRSVENGLENKENIPRPERSQSSENVLENKKTIAKAFLTAKQTDIVTRPYQNRLNYTSTQASLLYSFHCKKLDDIQEWKALNSEKYKAEKQGSAF
ncbi:kinesin-like protein KIF23 [Drosophila tropicalis]|uniref:kinesin-like protein KIF23 n=1 Tax=Drosophila tropicalis TaxID=46794 RepID=UPI0035AC0FF8